MKSTPSRKWLWLLPGFLAAGAIAVPTVSVFLRNGKAAAPPFSIENASVSCMGRVEPEDGVIRVSAPYFSGSPSLIEELKVKEGDWVHASQVLAVLDSRHVLETGVTQSTARIELTRSRLAQVKAGAKPEDIAVLAAELAKWQVSLGNAQAEYARYKLLARTHDVSSSELDEKRLCVETTQRIHRTDPTPHRKPVHSEGN